MVEYSQPGLDRTFAALGDPTRRVLISRLATGSKAVSELAKPFSMSLQAVIKHLDVLADAGLVTRKKTGRTVTCTLVAAPIANATLWLVEHQRHVWNDRLDSLDAYLRHVKQGTKDER